MDYKSYGSISTATCGSDELIPLYAKPKKQYKGISTSSYFFCIFLLVYAIFICSGAATFSFLEAPEETTVRVRLTEAIKTFLAAHPTVTGK